MIKQFDKWHKTRSGLLVFCLVELLIAYGFASLAIDQGDLWWYALALIFTVGALQNFFKLIGVLVRGKPKTSKA